MYAIVWVTMPVGVLTLMLTASAWNVALVVLTDAALMIRALYEERVLAGDRVYQTYCRRVAWHVVPGVF